MLTAADIMTSAVVTVNPDTSIHEIAALLREHHISGVPVVGEGDRVLGIVSEGDLIGHAKIAGEQRHSWWHGFFTNPTALAQHYAKSHGRTAGDVMTTDVVTVQEATSVADTAHILARNGIRRVPVVRDGKLVGIVSRSNLIGVLATTDVSKPMSIADRTIRQQLSDELDAQPWAHLLAKNIVVENGVVHLFGLVQSEEERNAVRLAAKNVPGVRAVEDHLMVMSPDFYSF
ncbi:CBS domain-containing protein [Microvirga brassicacearum]|uniref:CBS domain-containing protein n=1 Tax=Microvirga brassicacearum TaxID=2580413 RepID=A0A5N3P5S3_9HYPH|nr:CBS domain-containing protein [Microvirga brassicacearum]KAB0265001.1 CBS domain-containing protein [Microvirga brassicacearum]